MSKSFLGLAMLCFVLFLASCEKDGAVLDNLNSDTTSQNFVRAIQNSSAVTNGENEDSTDYEIDCFDFVYPFQLDIPGQGILDIASEEAFYDALDEWFDENEGEEDVEDYPTFVFPVQVVLEDGTAQSIADEEELCELHEECYGDDWEDEGDWDDEDWDEEHEEDMCFTFQFPVNIVLPDGTVSTANSEEELEGIFYNWFEENEEEEETYPTFEYPLTVELEDSTTQVINSDEELDELFDDCYDDFFEDCFEVNYPVDVQFPDGTVSNAADEDAFYDLIDTWYDALEEDEEPEDYPTFVYPIDVTFEDGTIETVNNEDDLEELYEECYEEECPVDGEALNTGGDEQVATKTVLKRKVNREGAAKR
ncbi:MAG: hypothetical protein ACPGVB_04050 [Chitinophagales bacterium]